MEWTTKVAKNRCENNKNWTSDKEPLNKGLMRDGWWWQISVIMCPTTVSQSLYSHLLFPNICISSAYITSVKSENAILYSFIIAAATVVNSLTNKQKTVNYSCWDFFKKLNLSSFILPGLQHIGEFSCLVPMICFMTHTHTHPFNGPFSGTTRVSRYQKGKSNLDFTEARDSECQWHQLGHMQVCTLLQTDNHASNPPLSFLQAGCPSCRPTNSVKALQCYPLFYDMLHIYSAAWHCTSCIKWKGLTNERNIHAHLCIFSLTSNMEWHVLHLVTEDLPSDFYTASLTCYYFIANTLINAATATTIFPSL